MCSPRECIISVVSLTTSPFETEIQFIPIYRTNYNAKLQRHQYVDINPKDNDVDNTNNQLLRDLLTKNAVIFIIRCLEDLAKLETLVSNPVIVYNHLLSVNLCYIPSDEMGCRTTPSFMRNFAAKFDILVHCYSKEKETEIIRNVVKECHAIAQIQRELCLKKINSNPLHRRQIGKDMRIGNYLVSIMLVFMASILWIKLYSFA